MTLKNIVFDLAGVVFYWRSDELVAEVFPDSVEQELIAVRLLGHEDWLELDRGTMPLDVAAERAAARTGLASERIATLLRRIPDHLVLNGQTLALLRRLKGEGRPLFCLSNMHTETIDVLEPGHDLWSLFDGVVISCRVGAIKPEPAIYRLLLDRFELDPAATVFVDDMQVNLDAASRFGITVVRFESASQCAREVATLGLLSASPQKPVLTRSERR